MSTTDFDKPQPFIGGIVASMAVKKLAGAMIEAGVGAAIKRAAAKSEVPIEPTDATKVAAEVAVEMAKDPSLVNAMNAEPLTQSRVVMGAGGASVVGTLTAMAIIWDQVSRRDFDLVTLGPAVTAVALALFALYGRLAKNLPPLWSRGK